jgi:prolyl-tRNA synthetase
MKDMYSFHANKDDLMKYYETVKQSYMDCFDELGLGDNTYITLASGGDFTDEFSHEFQTVLPVGEDLIFIAPGSNIAYNQEIAPSRAPDYQDHDEQQKPFEEIYGEDIVSVDRLVDFFQIPIWKTVKTMLYMADGQAIACSVRGDYEINELKLKKI